MLRSEVVFTVSAVATITSAQTKKVQSFEVSSVIKAPADKVWKVVGEIIDPSY